MMSLGTTAEAAMYDHVPVCVRRPAYWPVKEGVSLTPRRRTEMKVRSKRYALLPNLKRCIVDIVSDIPSVDDGSSPDERMDILTSGLLYFPRRGQNEKRGEASVSHFITVPPAFGAIPPFHRLAGNLGDGGFCSSFPANRCTLQGFQRRMRNLSVIPCRRQPFGHYWRKYYCCFNPQQCGSQPCPAPPMRQRENSCRHLARPHPLATSGDPTTSWISYQEITVRL